jgi:hypothetical protein
LIQANHQDNNNHNNNNNNMSEVSGIPGKFILSGYAGRRLQQVGGWKKRKLVLTDQYFVWYKTQVCFNTHSLSTTTTTLTKNNKNDMKEEGRFLVQTPNGEPLLALKDWSLESQEPNTFSVTSSANESTEGEQFFQTATSSDYFNWLTVLSRFSTTRVEINYENKVDVTERKKQQLLSSKAPPKPPAKPTQRSAKPDTPAVPANMVHRDIRSYGPPNQVDNPFCEQLPAVLRVAYDYSVLIEPSLIAVQQVLNQEQPNYQNATSLLAVAVSDNTELEKYITTNEDKISAVFAEFGHCSPALLLSQLVLHFLYIDYTTTGPPRRPQKPPPALPREVVIPTDDTTPVIATTVVVETPKPTPVVTKPTVVEPPPRERPTLTVQQKAPPSKISITTSPIESIPAVKVDLDSITNNRQRLAVITKTKSTRLSTALQIPSELSQEIDEHTQSSSASSSSGTRVAAVKKSGRRPPSKRNHSFLLAQVEKQATEESLTTIKDVVSKTPEPEPEPTSTDDKDKFLDSIIASNSRPMMGMRLPPMGTGFPVLKRTSSKTQEELSVPAVTATQEESADFRNVLKKPAVPPAKPTQKPSTPPKLTTKEDVPSETVNDVKPDVTELPKLPPSKPVKPARPPPTQLSQPSDSVGVPEEQSPPISEPLTTGDSADQSGGTPTSAKKVFGVPQGEGGFQAALASKLALGGGLRKVSDAGRQTPSTPTEDSSPVVDFRAGLKKTGSMFKPNTEAKVDSPSTENTTSEPSNPSDDVPPPRALKKGPPPTVPTSKPDTSNKSEETTVADDFRAQLNKRLSVAQQTNDNPESPSTPTNVLFAKKGPPPSVPPKIEKQADEESNVDFRSKLKKSTPSVDETSEESTTPSTPSSIAKKGPPPAVPSDKPVLQPGDLFKQLKKKDSPPSETSSPVTPSDEAAQSDFRSLLKKKSAPPPQPQKEEAQTAQQHDFRALLKKRNE